MSILRAWVITTIILISCGVCFADGNTIDTKSAPPIKSEEIKVSIEAKETKTADVLKTLSEKSKQKIIVESTVKGNVTISMNDAPLETILGTICKMGKFDWRKIYIDPDSKLLEQPDRLAATVRLVTGLSFPDIIISGSSGKKNAMHCETNKGVQAAFNTVAAAEGLKPVYVITNDAAVAAKEAEKNKAVNKYLDTAREQIDSFMNMTPEEREQAIVASLDLMNNIGPEYMSSVMQTLMSSNPEYLRNIVSRQTEMLFNMPTEQRRAMMRMNMQSMSYITPEQRQILQEDAKAIMEEMQKDAQNQQP